MPLYTEFTREQALKLEAITIPSYLTVCRHHYFAVHNQNLTVAENASNETRDNKHSLHDGHHLNSAHIANIYMPI